MGTAINMMPVQAVGNVLANDSDDNLPNPPSDLDVVNVVSEGTGNLMSIDGDGNFVIVGLYGTLVLNGETGEFVYTVNEKNPDVDSMNYGDSIQDIFTYTVSDSILTDTATLTITINGTNDAPIATADEGFAKERGYMEAGEFASGNVITDSETGDHDVDSDTLLIIDLKTGEPHGGAAVRKAGMNRIPCRLRPFPTAISSPKAPTVRSICGKTASTSTFQKTAIPSSTA